MNVGERIKSLRQQKGLTLEQVGLAVGVGKSTVRKWEQGTIENMRRDKIAKLASVLGTTPDFLMGWKSDNDPWSTAFRQALELELTVADSADIEASGIDIDRFEKIAAGEIPISLSEACDIADQLGTSLDYMVGLRDIDSKALEFIDLFSKLTGEQQKMLIMQLKGLLSNE